MNEEKILEDAYRNLRNPLFFPDYCRDFLKIQTKEATLVPFEFNRSQEIAWKIILPYVVRMLENGEGAWFIILKARQVGISTLIEAIIDWLTSLLLDRRSLIMAHDADTSSRLYEMFLTYHRHKPDWLKPHTSSSGNAKGLRFDQMRSSVRVITAGSDTATSGDTFQLAHLSEYAKWEHPREVMASLTPALPKNSLVFIESTPFGMNHFYAEWIAATQGKSRLVPIFLPWFNDEGYSLDSYKGKQVELTGDARYYADKYALKQGQINWMQSQVETPLCSGDYNIFLQEFPFNDVDCFLSSGTPYFDTKALRALDIELRTNPPESEECEILNGSISRGKGSVTIYDLPDDKDKIKYRYVIAADCCEGGGKFSINDDNKRAGDTDYNFAVVWDKVLQKQVAMVRNRFDPDIFATQLFDLWKIYANGIDRGYYPLMIVERNNPGQAVLMKLKELASKDKIPFSRLFHEGRMDLGSEPSIKELGFRTQAHGESPRFVILQAVQSRIREGISGIKSLAIVNQCMTFVLDKNNKPMAQEGRYDDGVIAMALAYEGERRDLRYERIITPEPIPKWVQKLRGTGNTGSNPYKLKSINNPYK